MASEDDQRRGVESFIHRPYSEIWGILWGFKNVLNDETSMSNYMIKGDKLEFYNNFPIFMSLIYKLKMSNSGSPHY